MKSHLSQEDHRKFPMLFRENHIWPTYPLRYRQRRSQLYPFLHNIGMYYTSLIDVSGITTNFQARNKYKCIPHNAHVLHNQ